LIEEYIKAVDEFDSEAIVAMRGSLGSIDAKAIPDALTELQEIKGSDGWLELMYLLLGRLAQSDPQAAIAYLCENIAQSGGNNYAHSVFSNIANKLGHEKALDLYLKNTQLAQGQVGISSLKAIFGRWAQRDLDSAIAAVSRIEGEGHRRSVISSIAASASNPEARELLLPWARSLSNPKERGSAIQQVANKWAEYEEPDVVLAWVEEGEVEPNIFHGVEQGIAVTKLLDDPENAAEWLMGRATEESYPDHLTHIVTQWAMRAPNAAGRWLREQELDARADHAVAGFANLVVRDDPESAFEWAKTITSEARRNSTLDEVLRVWERIDPAAAARARQDE